MSSLASLRVDRPRSCRASARGFTLIELIVALVLAAGVLGLATGILASASKKNRVIATRAELTRKAALINTMMLHDLRAAGLGRPLNGDIVDSILLDAVLVATPTGVGVLGDLARPDANFNSMGYINSSPAGTGATPRENALAWHNENNGSCMPDTGGTCSTGDSSVFFPGEDGCDAAGAFNDRTCPWGMKRLRNGDRFQIISGQQYWTSALFDSPVGFEGPNGHVFATWTDDWRDISASDDTWPNCEATNVPAGIIGLGWVTTLDRVFYRREGAAAPYRLQRMQCWGDPMNDALNASFPPSASNTMPADPSAATNFDGSTQAAQCTGWETLATGVSSVTFRYFADDGTEITPVAAADKPSIRRIQWRIVLEKAALDVNVRHDVLGSAAIRNTD